MTTYTTDKQQVTFIEPAPAKKSRTAEIREQMQVYGRTSLSNSDLLTLIVAHNHPSGDPDPSPEDVEVTKKIIEAGELLDIEVLDHIIIGADSHVSLKDRGLI